MFLGILIAQDSYMINFSTENFYGPCNGSEQFQCSDGCIFSKYVCDGENDCSGGEDEENCLNYMNFFKSETDYKVSHLFE